MRLNLKIKTMKTHYPIVEENVFIAPPSGHTGKLTLKVYKFKS